jgi:hypothetical protein
MVVVKRFRDYEMSPPDNKSRTSAQLLLHVIVKSERYFQKYLHFCHSRQHRGIKKTKGFHRHHIFPKSFIRIDEEWNIVLLTHREHYLAHLLLVKACEHSKALKGFIHVARKVGITNSRAYSSREKSWRESQRDHMIAYYSDPENRRKTGEKSKGKKRSEETKQKQQEAALRRYQDPEEREKTRQAALNRKPYTPEQLENFKAAAKRRMENKETREKISKSLKGNQNRSKKKI